MLRAILAWSWLSLLSFSISGASFVIKSSAGMSFAASERKSSAPGKGRPLPKISTSSSRSECAMADSCGAGSNFLPVMSVSCESAREWYFHAFGIVGCAAKRSAVANEPSSRFVFACSQSVMMRQTTYSSQSPYVATLATQQAQRGRHPASQT